MSNRSIGLSPELHAWLVRHAVRETDALRRLREETAALEEADMQIAPEQGAFMAMLARMTGARRALEIGVFTGYSSIAVAQALPDDGMLTACDANEEYARVARRYWREAGVEGKIEFRPGDAADTLRALLDEGRGGAYDFAFVDADKISYGIYYEQVLQLLCSGGVVVLDNMLRNGRVLNPAADDLDSQSIAALSAAIVRDDRVDCCMVPIADGVTLARKR